MATAAQIARKVYSRANYDFTVQTMNLALAHSKRRGPEAIKASYAIDLAKWVGMAHDEAELEDIQFDYDQEIALTGKISFE
jgi:hypothetical protein